MNLVRLNSKLNRSIGKYSFYQCIRMAVTYFHHEYPHESFESLYKRLRFKTNPSLSFAKSEISKLEFCENSKGYYVEITLNFLSLSGSSSPLPSHYSEMILHSHNEDKVLSSFIDFFNHHLHKLVYVVWVKQRYYVQYTDTLEDKFSNYILSILGLYSREQIQNSKLNIKKLMPYVGLLSMKQKSAGTLTSILRHYFEHDDIEIIQFITMKANIPLWQRSSLGNGNCSLSSDFLLGESVKTKSAKFQILLKNIPWKGLVNYSILGEKLKELKGLIHLALNEPLEYELCLGIQKNEVQPISLSSKYLGVNSFLGIPKSEKKILVSN
jgi:type VI secretion system protein ImpH